MTNRTKTLLWWLLIGGLVVFISVLHYRTSTVKWQFHLLYMQAYFIPILMAAFQFGIKGGVGTALAVTLIYFPHIMLQWGGFVETNLVRFLQLLLFNIIGYLTGVKAQKEREEKVRYQRTARELEESLALLQEQREKLAEMEDQLHQADRLAIIGELAASLAHEIRNPLGSIRGTVEILRDELPVKGHLREFYDILIQETERLSAVVENYLQFGRKQTNQISRIEVGELIRNVAQLLSYRAKKTKVNLTLESPQEPIFIHTNPTDLRQVLVNLVLNGLQATGPQGKVTIRWRKIPGYNANPGQPEAQRVPPLLEICVCDNGKGIPPEQLEHIFKPFYTTKLTGTGLGLAIVNRLVKKHNWQIRVESQAGKGTEFILTFPLKEG